MSVVVRLARVTAVAVAIVLGAAGCGTPSDPKKQAEEVASVAAEGALLARDAVAGRSTGPFTRAHARDLLERLTSLRPKIAERRLARLERETSRALRALQDDPFDARVGPALEEAAKSARELAQ
jgi:hypothetical protein